MKRQLILALLIAFISAITSRLDAQLYRIPKQAQAASARLEGALQRLPSDQRIAVMVYFTDKAVFTDREFRAAADARRAQLSERALRRRAKMGLTAMSFEDLPVNPAYIGQVLSFGAKLRQRLNWFNAATFDMTADQARAAAQLGCVQRMDLVVSLRAPLEPETVAEPLPAPTPAPKSHLMNYGYSYTQDSIINVVICHDSGFSGSGVLVAMFDDGFKKSHPAFDSIRIDGRLVDEWDFTHGWQSVDSSFHGTGTWSEAGGYVPGQLIGPAYKALWAIYHTEVGSSEHHIEEDYWAAALQRADSAGVDVVSSSLGYRYNFTAPDTSYTYQGMDGNTTICSQAAHHASALGIIVCNAMGNEGPTTGSLNAPADADSILSVGNVNSLGVINATSSRGPTYDGRPKPEVCAQGTQVWWANWDTTINYSRANGTSCATPLVAGSCALVLQAHPAWTPMQVRQALMMTASRQAAPDSTTYGWGIIDVWAAIHYDGATGAGHGPSSDAGPRLALSCYPNPVRSAATIAFTLPRAGTARIALYDALGRLVRSFPATAAARGPNKLRWDGRDQAGRIAAAGVYFCRCSAPGGSGTVKVVVVR